MKNIKSLSAILIIILTVFSCAPSQKAKTSTVTDVKNMVDSQQYVFIAQTVQPMNGRTRHLTSVYDFKVSKDTITSFLPYFGRAFSTAPFPTEGGIKFTSANFEYTVEIKEDKQWDITIKPKDAPGIQQVNLTIFSNGSASVQVTSNNRQSISYQGYIDRKSS